MSSKFVKRRGKLVQPEAETDQVITVGDLQHFLLQIENDNIPICIRDNAAPYKMVKQVIVSAARIVLSADSSE